MSILAYVHAPKPPYQRISGGIGISGVRRDYGLSSASRASFTVAAEDVLEAWLRPGMCWALEHPEIGEPLWAGFIATETLAFRASDVAIDLLGPKEALLSSEIAIRLPERVSLDFAIKEILLAVQSRLEIVMFPGEIDQVEGAAINLDVRAETASDYIDTLRDAVAGLDWRERVVMNNNQLRFFLDFGVLRCETNIVLQDNDIVDGLLKRERLPTSFTSLSQAPSFAERRAVTTTVRGSRIAPEPADGALLPIGEPLASLLRERDIGPAAGRHAIEISERISNSGIGYHATERHLELLGNVDEFTLTLDGTKTRPQQVQLGDVVSLQVADWALGAGVNSRIHIRNIEPQDEAGKRTVTAQVLL